MDISLKQRIAALLMQTVIHEQLGQRFRRWAQNYVDYLPQPVPDPKFGVSGTTDGKLLLSDSFFKQNTWKQASLATFELGKVLFYQSRQNVPFRSFLAKHLSLTAGFLEGVQFYGADLKGKSGYPLGDIEGESMFGYYVRLAVLRFPSLTGDLASARTDMQGYLIGILPQ